MNPDHPHNPKPLDKITHISADLGWWLSLR